VVKSKTVDKKINASRKVMRKELKRVKKKSVAQGSEIAKLRIEVEKLKKKKAKSGHISEYNFFIKKQILSGLTFTQAARQWGKYKALQNKNKRRPSAYNQFIGSQMRLGKTFLQAVALWKLAKAGKLGKKGSTKTITKTVVRTIKSKPKIKYRTRTKTRTVVRRIKSKPKIKYRTRTQTKYKTKYRTKTKTVVRRIKSKPAPLQRTRKVTRITRPGFNASEFKRTIESSSISKSDLRNAMNPDDEEIAFKMVETYFKEIARLGFKRQLSLDEIINAYFYALARVKRKGVEEKEVMEAVKEAERK